IYSTIVRGVAMSAAGDVGVAGGFSSPINCGGAPFTLYSGFFDSFVARFAAANGTQIWAETFPNFYSDRAVSVAVDGQDNVALTGIFSGHITFGGTTLTVSGAPIYD